MAIKFTRDGVFMIYVLLFMSINERQMLQLQSTPCMNNYVTTFDSKLVHIVIFQFLKLNF